MTKQTESDPRSSSQDTSQEACGLAARSTTPDVQQLSGMELDAAVARAMGLPCKVGAIGDDGYMIVPALWRTPGRNRRETDWMTFQPSTEWHDGGPIIEREHIEIAPLEGGGWDSITFDSESMEPSPASSGPTPLIAAMRAFVASKSEPASKAACHSPEPARSDDKGEPK